MGRYLTPQLLAPQWLAPLFAAALNDMTEDGTLRKLCPPCAESILDSD